MLAANMIQIRALLDLSQKELADATGIDRSKISRIERGAPANHTELMTLAAYFGCSVDFLLAPHKMIKASKTVTITVEEEPPKERND